MCFCLQNPVVEAAVALLFRSLECHAHLWQVWDHDVMAYGLLHCLAALAAVYTNSERRPWFRHGVDSRMGLAAFGPSAAMLHDVLHDLMKPPPVFLRAEISGVTRVVCASARVFCALTGCLTCFSACPAVCDHAYYQRMRVRQFSLLIVFHAPHRMGNWMLRL